MRVAIIGSRDYPNPDKIKDFVSQLVPGTIVVSGGARGVDSIAEQAAKDCGLEVLIFPADWDKYGKAAGFIRNQDIIDNADMVVAFWDGKSKGTKHSLDLAQKAGKYQTIFLA